MIFRRIFQKLFSREAWRHWGQEHGLALLGYALLAVAVSWPAVRDFTTRILSDGGDAKHQLYILWHTQQWVLGRQPLFYAPLLFYPHGISLLLHSLGPVMGLLALPFWVGGPAAAYNGSAIVGLWLTGYCMYLLARDRGLDRLPAFFAGTMLLVAPIHLVGIEGHMERVFLGLLPLTLLALHRALSPERGAWWCGVTALLLLSTALYSGYLFIYTATALFFFLLVACFTAQRDHLLFLLGRIALLLGSCLVLVGPYLYAVIGVSSDPTFAVDLGKESFLFSPDLVQFFLPPYYHPLWGSLFLKVAEEGKALFGGDYLVSLFWTGIVLNLMAWFRGDRQSRRWLILMLGAMLLSLGPTLRAFGATEFTKYKLPVVLPYALLTSLPGLEFMRIPGRFMMLGYVGAAMGAGWGLSWLTGRFPRWRFLTSAVFLALLLLEAWPAPWPQETLPPVPRFYQEIARDPEMYGVFDLPLQSSPGLDPRCTSTGGCNFPSAYYEFYQITHGKGIFLGYISRSYVLYPPLADLAACCRPGETDVRVNGRSSQPCILVQSKLVQMGFRYVVWHKTLYPGSPGQDTAAAFVHEVFGEQPPLVDDDLVTVYALPRVSELPYLTPTIILGNQWYRAEEKHRWAASPATIVIWSPRQQPALLEIVPATFHDPSRKQGTGDTGLLHVQAGPSFSDTLSLLAGRPAVVPLLLPQGNLTLTLTLEAGNFRPSQYGGTDDRLLSFAIRSLDLRLADGMALPDDIHINGQPQPEAGEHLFALFGNGWYKFEGAPVGRWARSPAKILLYSPQTQTVRLKARPTFLYSPEAPGGLGPQGLLHIRVNDEEGFSLRIGSQRTFQADLPLQAGWNEITLELEAGNFQPKIVQPGNPDSRWLSFALEGIDVVQK